MEVSNAVNALEAKLKALVNGGELREYVMLHYLLLYERFDTAIYLLSTRHQRQLSFDFQSLWAAKP